MEAPKVAAPMAAVTKPKEETIAAFLNNGIKMMQREDVRQLLKTTPSPGSKLIELQRAEWDPLGVDRDLGCKHLDQIEVLFPGNQELVGLRNEFICTAMRSYLRTLDDLKPATLEREKPMPRDTIVEFFDACNTKMDLPETRAQLQEHMQKKKEIPNQLIIDIQRDMLEVFGFERDHGCAMLSRIPIDFPKDQELHQKFELWRRKAQGTCMSVVKQHQMNGGEMPAQPFGSGASPELMKRAEDAVNAMSPEQRKELLEKFQKKVEVYFNLPAEAKVSYMTKLPEDEKLEFAKAQLIMVHVMQATWNQQQRHEHEHGHAHGGADAAAAAPGRGACESTPQQQQMM